MEKNFKSFGQTCLNCLVFYRLIDLKFECRLLYFISLFSKVGYKQGWILQFCGNTGKHIVVLTAYRVTYIE